MDAKLQLFGRTEVANLCKPAQTNDAAQGTSQLLPLGIIKTGAKRNGKRRANFVLKKRFLEDENQLLLLREEKIRLPVQICSHKQAIFENKKLFLTTTFRARYAHVFGGKFVILRPKEDGKASVGNDKGKLHK